ncbi:ATP-NAD kinase family protein [Thermococcus paralvinellae]|uniref:ATP-NAD/AcoX kinase n=1 Tax=Thermococcus paralvinellae TaxID=582419 RepID=W0I511_9EURY|nr:NAD(+)/NADH kinase [Thermococcus paralvinellae]AHF79458.1 Putative ATP-NAD/AcoX kinase [Thermococcus paralvinellae]
MKKATVGIIANPESGRDIRRLIAHASVFDNMEKVSIVKRLLMILQSFGVEKVLAMPETFGIVPAAMHLIEEHLNLEVEFLPIKVFGTWRDTYEATKLMKDKVSVIIVIGGDGTNRVVAKVCGDTPIMPISTGTNNVFPYMIEATIAAEAVVAIATGIVKPEEGTYKAKRVEIFEEGELKDIALIDAAATTHSFVGSRAVWKPEYLKEIVVSICSPSNIGLSSIPGIIKEIREDEDLGLYAELGEGKKIRAPIAPGVLREVSIKSYRTLELGEEVEIKTTPSLFALDGEREAEVKGEVTARVTRNGPRVIDYQKTLKIAAERGFFDG